MPPPPQCSSPHCGRPIGAGRGEDPSVPWRETSITRPAAFIANGDFEHGRLTGVLRRCATFALIGLVAAACGASGSATPSPSAVAGATTAPSTSQATPPSSAPSPSPSATAGPSKGPATAHLALVGDAGLTGPVTARDIYCGPPSLDGPQIEILGQAGTAGPMIVAFLMAGHAEVRVATGSGASLRLRSFVGTGVTGFDATSGAQLDSSLTETTDATTNKGDLGAVTSITGTVDCGDQQPGTASVRVSGQSAQGPLDGTLTDAYVLCTVTASGTFVAVRGLMTTGTTPLLVFVTGSSGVLRVVVDSRAAASPYVGNGAGLVTLVSGGAHMAGDVTESVAAGTTPHTLHVEGDATCGLTVKR